MANLTPKIENLNAANRRGKGVAETISLSLHRDVLALLDAAASKQPRSSRSRSKNAGLLLLGGLEEGGYLAEWTAEEMMTARVALLEGRRIPPALMERILPGEPFEPMG